MDVPVDIPGLNQFISSIPSGHVILVRGGNDPVKSYFAQYIGDMSRRAGQGVVYVTSRGRQEVLDQYRLYFENGEKVEVVESNSPMRWMVSMRESTTLIIDSFSYLMIEKDSHALRSTLEELRKACRHYGTIALLTVESGMMAPMQEAAMLHLVDGIIDFFTKETSEGLIRYMRVSRWMDGRVFDNNIFYTFDERRINVDLRYRVV